MMKITAFIPARMSSTRFPGKPLKKILDLPMIEHVRRRAILCPSLDDVVVATCDNEIKDVVEGFGGKAVMTSDLHKRCTDRVEEAVQNLEADIVVILQGDEPLIIPEVITALIKPIYENREIVCTNLISMIKDEDDLNNSNIVKAAINLRHEILFYSRAAIPFRRAQGQDQAYRQTGLSAFTKSFLHTFSKLTPTPLEVAESIDFLRILEHGHRITGVVYDQPTVGVDLLDDISIVEEILMNEPTQKAIFERIAA